MGRLSRRTYVYLGSSASAQLMRAGEPGIAQGADNHPVETNSEDVQQRLLELAARQESTRRAGFADVKSQAQPAELQRSLRTKFLGLIGGLPVNTGAPPVKIRGGRSTPRIT